MPYTVSDMEVLVVGAGPSGLTLACDLVRRGVRTHVIEAAHQLFAGSRGKGIQPRTQETFDDLGVMETLRAAGGPFPPMRTWRDGRHREAWKLIEPDPQAPVSRYPEPWMVPQWRTQEILKDRLLGLGGTVRFGARLVSLRQTDQRVQAELAHADGRHETLTVPYLVGADGGRSTVREALGIAMRGEEGGLRPAVVADVRVRGLDRGHWHVWPDAPGGSLLLCPLPGTDDFQLSARIDGPDAAATAQTVRDMIAARTHLPADAVTDVPWMSYYKPRTGLAERFREGRVFLVGDAAHVHPPGGGQGLNIGVQDAYNLGWKLGQVVRHRAPAELLDSYEAERRPVAAHVLELSARLYRAGRRPEGADRQARHRGRVSHLLSVHYRDSPLSSDTRERLSPTAARAGDRAPDLPCVTVGGDGPRPLSELLRGPQFTLLAVDCEPTRVPTGAHVHRVTDSPLAEELGRGLFLLRPDGHIGLATRDSAHLTRYLAKVGLRVGLRGTPA
ncbi:FAD-dependent monooxygenase [Streptomyces phyllanthi]|uniref:Pentachlorophenol monooxygenase n=1 Tax=Streptomyces phyllanthi TaxID=1803180 RepID=A0A5N8W066_9ACTN|nr:FAD-dependent monooxygenase [Streptomyces phyllanthi]MPY40901.1 pentachlorophenol monooxygenase [Streptomyces phyllanthi]